MSQYVVVSPDGKRFGPTDFQTLGQWAREGRVAPGMTILDVLSGQTMLASAVPGLFADTAWAAPPPPTPPQAEAARGNSANLSVVLGFVGLIGWCLPILGLPIGVVAILAGSRALRTPDRTKALIGLSLGILCVLLSLVNAILGVMLLQSIRG